MTTVVGCALALSCAARVTSLSSGRFFYRGRRRMAYWNHFLLAAYEDGRHADAEFND